MFLELLVILPFISSTISMFHYHPSIAHWRSTLSCAHVYCICCCLSSLSLCCSCSVSLGPGCLLITACVSAAVSEKVKEGKAHGVEMCGEKLVLFRGKDGKVSRHPAPLLLSSKKGAAPALFVTACVQALQSCHALPSCRLVHTSTSALHNRLHCHGRA